MVRLAPAPRELVLTANVKVAKPVKSRYVLVWFTALPYAQGDTYSEAGYKQAITDLKFTG